MGSGESVQLQCDELLHSTLEPSPRPSGEINNPGRPALPSQAMARRCFSVAEASAASLSLNGDKSWTDCLFGEGV